MASLKAAKTSEAIVTVINTNDLGYSWRKDIPEKPKANACSHARLLKQLQMDARDIIPVGEKDMLWTLLVAHCDI